MRWQSLFRGKSRQEEQPDSEAWGAFAKILTSDAMHNRAALKPETLRLYRRMFAAASETADQSEGMRLSGRLGYQLLSAFAQEAGKSAPDTPMAALEFLKHELRGFDTPEAADRRARAELDEMKRLLKG